VNKSLLFLLVILAFLPRDNSYARETFGRGPIWDFNLSASLGNVEHVSQDFIVGVSLGMSQSNGFVTIWDNAFSITPLSGATEVFINSTDASDDQQFTVQGLDSSFKRNSITVTVSGQTQVSVGTFTHVQTISLLAGDAEPAGDIYVAKSSTLTAGVPLDADVQSKIIQGYNITHNGFFMVPVGETATTMANRGSTTSESFPTEIQIHITLPEALASFITVQHAIIGGMNNLDFPAPVASVNIVDQLNPVLDEKTFVEFKAKPSSGSAVNVFFGTDLFLIDREYIGLSNPN